MVDDAGLLLYASAGLLLVAALLSEILTERDARHRPVCIALALLSVCMIVRLALHAAVLHGGPYAGWARAAYHFEQLTRLVTAMLPAWLTWAALGRRGYPPGPSMVAIGYMIGGWVTLVVTYPSISGEALRLGYLSAELVSLALAVASILSWTRRSWPRIANPMAHDTTIVRPDGTRCSPPDGPRAHTWLAVLMIVGADIALLFVGAWRHGLFGDAYRLQQAGLVALYGALVVLHVIALRIARSA